MPWRNPCMTRILGLRIMTCRTNEHKSSKPMTWRKSGQDMCKWVAYLELHEQLTSRMHWEGRSTLFYGQSFNLNISLLRTEWVSFDGLTLHFKFAKCAFGFL
jgi:hypothetical protein